MRLLFIGIQVEASMSWLTICCRYSSWRQTPNVSSYQQCNVAYLAPPTDFYFQKQLYSPANGDLLTLLGVRALLQKLHVVLCLDGNHAPAVHITGIAFTTKQHAQQLTRSMFACTVVILTAPLPFFAQTFGGAMSLLFTLKAIILGTS